MIIPQAALSVAAITFICAMMSIAMPKEPRVIFTTLAVFGLFYSGFILLGSAFNLSQNIVYGAIGLCCFAAFVYVVTQAKSICADDVCVVEQVATTH